MLLKLNKQLIPTFIVAAQIRAQWSKA